MDQLRQYLDGRIPPQALNYAVQLWVEAPFEFRISKSRSSKLGDYRYDPRTAKHQVSVNQDLNPYQFLITYVHEVAHRRVHDVKRRLKPHGSHWKSEFKRLLLPIMNDRVFPDDVLRPLARHMKNPKASTAGDPILFAALSGYDEITVGQRLVELAIGNEFVFRKREFKLLEKKRTRALCLDLDDGRRYLIPMVAEVNSSLRPLLQDRDAACLR